MVKPEPKHFDTVVNVTAILSAGGVDATPLNVILQGDASNSRDGARVHIHKVMFRGTISLKIAGDADDVVRVIIFQDTQASGTTPTPGLILQSLDENSFKHRDRTQRFIFLADWRIGYSVNSLNVAGTGFVPKLTTIEMFKDTNFETYFIANTSVFGAISKNSVGILTIAQNDDTSKLIGIARVTYTDV